MSEHLYLISIGLIPATILVIFGMKYYSALRQAAARLARDDAYRKIAEQAVATQTESAAALAAIQASLADVRTRLAAVETILKAVE